MTTSEKGLNLIKESEGFRSEAYIDPTGTPTIGYGTTRIKGQPVKLGMTCTKEEAETYLKNDLAEFEKAVNLFVKVELSQNQFDAIMSLVYNIGIGAFKRSTLLKKINSNDLVATEWMKWVYSKGKRLPGLVERREKELSLYFENLTATPRGLDIIP